MNIINKMNQTHYFSPSEQSVISFILKNPTQIRDLNAKNLAALAYSSPSTVIRLCKKLGCNGFNDFKIEFISDYDKLNEVKNINANYPFNENDSLSQISKNLSKLYIDAINETLSLTDLKDYQLSIDILYNAKYIDIYGVGTNQSLAFDFKMNLMRIGKHVNIYHDKQQLIVNAAYSNNEHAAIIISYTGETTEVLEYCTILKETDTPMICITSFDDNSISDLCDISLRIVSKEKMFSKIGMFSSKISIIMILDILYSGIFKKDYYHNIELSKRKRRTTTKFQSTSPILIENTKN